MKPIDEQEKTPPGSPLQKNSLELEYNSPTVNARTKNVLTVDTSAYPIKESNTNSPVSALGSANSTGQRKIHLCDEVQGPSFSSTKQFGLLYGNDEWRP
jgi:hypothetical protein